MNGGALAIVAAVVVLAVCVGIWARYGGKR